MKNLKTLITGLLERAENLEQEVKIRVVKRDRVHGTVIASCEVAIDYLTTIDGLAIAIDVDCIDLDADKD